MSVFAQNHVNPSYRQGFSFEVESGYADNGGYFDISSGCNVIHGLYWKTTYDGSCLHSGQV